jgi:hypothetical protein
MVNLGRNNFRERPDQPGDRQQGDKPRERSLFSTYSFAAALTGCQDAAEGRVVLDCQLVSPIPRRAQTGTAGPAFAPGQVVRAPCVFCELPRRAACAGKGDVRRASVLTARASESMGWHP